MMLRRQPHGQTLQPTIFMAIERFAAMQQATVVPQDDIADLPVVRINEGCLSGVRVEIIEQCASFHIGKAGNTHHRRRVEIEGFFPVTG
jgi:hypothetical protein